MTRIDDVREAIRRAMDEPSQDAVVSGVKGIVASEINGLDSSVEITLTSNFNHTYLPDMFLSWPGSGNKSAPRPVYLRNTFSEGVTNYEVRELEGSEPIVLGLTSAEPQDVAPVRESVNLTRQVLVSDVDSVATLRAETTSSNAPQSPVLRVVQSSILRLGEGLLDGDLASGLADAAERVTSTEAQTASQGMADLERYAYSVYNDTGAYQLSRAAQIIQAVTTGQALPADVEGGRLSESDVRILLPYLLARHDIRDDSELWDRVSRLVDLSDLEDVRELEDADIVLSPLLTSSALDGWTAVRATLVANSDAAAGDASETTWRLRSGLLTAEVGPWLLIFAGVDKRKLKGHDDSVPAIWEDISLSARALAVDEADLRGITRRVSISAEESGNVLRDVDELTQTLTDSYRVISMGVRVPGSEFDATIDVDFKKMLASAEGHSSVRDIGTVALLLLGRREPTRPSWLAVVPTSDS
ncbi:MAG: hypothetical protein QM728_05090 [Gordonia sp. (in: high G+C Gram-positive bacteria)]|uniref:hypothetical protein n=1 Tax=Gordonia sp. (in: high G+C Gram-positive bacteria) TaxID=84139 RepID=UPI0039E4CE85